MRNAFLYYIENGKSVAENRLVELGFPQLEGMAIAVREVLQGPGGTSGALFVPREHKGLSKHAAEYCKPDVRVGYYPKEQEWTNTGDGLWIGWENGKQPKPVDLERADATSGRFVDLYDDNQWLIPSRDCLPSRFGFDGKGGKTTIPRGRGIPAGAAIDWLVGWRTDGAQGVGRDYDEVLENIAAVLTVNYRVGVKECVALGLFGPDNLDRVVSLMLCDEEVRDMLDAVADAEKKSDAVATPDT